MPTAQANKFVAHFVARCGAFGAPCAANGSYDPNLWRSVVAHLGLWRRFVAQLVARLP